ncbi:MAG: hypothetical protein IID46_05925, partial [Planctomycetes bacterium]|nr:hypothetical protein [Planctomycetota bacterium]
MGSFFRVFPYIWPYRRRVLLSFFFALMVAVLWGLILGTTYPVMKVLVKGQSLSQYVEEEIADLSDDIKNRTLAIQELDQQLQDLEAGRQSESSRRKVELLKAKARQQSKLNWPSKKLLWMNRIKADVVPLFPKDQFDLLALILGIILAATILKGVCVWTQEVLVGSTVELTTMSLRKACFRHILKLDYQTASMSGSSDIMSRFTYDMNLLSTGLTLVGGKIVREPLKALCCIVGA